MPSTHLKLHTVPIEKQFALDEIVEAHKYMESNASKGGKLEWSSKSEIHNRDKYTF